MVYKEKKEGLTSLGYISELEATNCLFFIQFKIVFPFIDYHF